MNSEQYIMKMCLHYIQETWHELNPQYQMDKQADYDAVVKLLEAEIGGRVGPCGMLYHASDCNCEGRGGSR